MKQLVAGIAMLVLAVPAAMAYQVTGPVIDVTDTRIVVEKDKEKWEIARDKDTKVSGELRKGSRVTVQYRMTATSIEAKDAKGKSAEKKPAAAKDAGIKK